MKYVDQYGRPGNDGPRVSAHLDKVPPSKDLLNDLATLGAGHMFFKQSMDKSRDAISSRFENLQNLLEILRTFYAARLDGNTPGTFNLDFQGWADIFTEYSYVNQGLKISERVQEMLVRRNFGTILTSSLHQLEAKEMQRHGFIESHQAKESLSNRPFCKGGPDSPNASLPDNCRKNQTKRQADALEAIYGQIAIWIKDGVEIDSSNMSRDWNSSCLNSHDKKDVIFYSKNGRLEFHSLLSSILKAIQHCDGNVSKARVDAFTSAASSSESERPKLTFSLMDQTRALMQSFLCLSYLRTNFGGLLESHYKWLFDIFEPESTHQPGEAWKDERPNDLRWTRRREASLSESGTGSVSLMQHAARHSAGSASNQGSSFDMSSVRSSLPPPTEDDNPKDDDPSYKALDKKIWHVAASESLGCLNRHQESVDSLLEAEKTQAERFMTAEIQPVIVTPDMKDERMMPTLDVLRQYKLEGAEWTDQDLKLLAELLDGQRGKSKNTFGGAHHAETNMFSLHLLARKRNEMVDRQKEEGEAANALDLPPKSTTDKFKKLSVPMAVNKRCCPVCFQVLRRVEEVTGVKFLCSGHHSDWWATTLPPWIPKEDFEAIMQHILEFFWEMVKILQVHGDRTDRSGHSGGTRSAPTRSTVSAKGSQSIARLQSITARRDKERSIFQSNTTSQPSGGPVGTQASAQQAERAGSQGAVGADNSQHETHSVTVTIGDQLPKRPDSYKSKTLDWFGKTAATNQLAPGPEMSPGAGKSSAWGTPLRPASTSGFLDTPSGSSAPSSAVRPGGVSPSVVTPLSSRLKGAWNNKPGSDLFRNSRSPSMPGKQSLGSSPGVGGEQSDPSPGLAKKPRPLRAQPFPVLETTNRPSNSSSMPPPPRPKAPQAGQKRQASQQLQNSAKPKRDGAGLRNLGSMAVAATTVAATTPGARPAAQPAAPSVLSSNPFAALANLNPGQEQSSQGRGAHSSGAGRGSHRGRPRPKRGGQEGKK